MSWMLQLLPAARTSSMLKGSLHQRRIASLVAAPVDRTRRAPAQSCIRRDEPLGEAVAYLATPVQDERSQLVRVARETANLLHVKLQRADAGLMAIATPRPSNPAAACGLDSPARGRLRARRRPQGRRNAADAHQRVGRARSVHQAAARSARAQRSVLRRQTEKCLMPFFTQGCRNASRVLRGASGRAHRDHCRLEAGDGAGGSDA